VPNPGPRTGLWTVADIGGTHARLATWALSSGLGTQLRVRNDDYRGPIDLLQGWLDRHRGASRQVLLALAMPVGADATTLTNRAWHFEPRALVSALELERLVIVNDFAAAAAGIDSLSADAIVPLDPARSAPDAAMRLVLGPGTGLGAAAIWTDGGQQVIASEAGHMSFGSADPLAERLLADGRRRWGRVSWERVLCGDGLAWIDAVLTDRTAVRAPAEIAQHARTGEAGALNAVRVFSRLLGEFAGDACLAFRAGAVYLTGGVLHGIAASFDAAGFLAAFADKGRFALLLNRVPCYRVAGHELGLAGAARFLAGKCDMPASQFE
jgi:glucokinase